MVGDQSLAASLGGRFDFERWEPSDEGRFTRALRSPWCWPGDAALSARAVELGFPEADPPFAGEVPVVSVRGDKATLWRLLPDTLGRLEDKPLVGQAQQAADDAWDLASAALPAQATLAPGKARRPWGARVLAKMPGGGLGDVLDGPSFGLALCIAAASCLLQTRTQRRVLALASVEPDRTLARVGGLERKLELAGDWALGIDLVLVAPDQLDLARSLLRAARPDLADSIRAPHDLDEALRMCWDDLFAVVLREWHSPEERTEVIEGLFHCALRQTARRRSWQSLAGTARLLAAQVREVDPHAAWKADMVGLIARQREGHAADVDGPAQEHMELLPRPVALSLTARVLEAAVDCPAGERLGDLGERLELALQQIPDDAGIFDEHVVLLGAVGRVQAALGQLTQAEETLERAIRLWGSLDMRHGRCGPIGELLRVRALRGDGDGVRRLLDGRYSGCLGGSAITPRNQAILRWQAARALLVVGDHDGALEQLKAAGPHLADAPSYVDRASRRCRAAALDGVGDVTGARAIRRELERRGAQKRRLPPNVVLSRLDEALAAGADPSTHLEALFALDLSETRRLQTPPPWSVEDAKRVAREFRY